MNTTDKPKRGRPVHLDGPTTVVNYRTNATRAAKARALGRAAWERWVDRAKAPAPAP